MTSQTNFNDLSFFKDWMRRVFPNSQAVALAIILIVGFVLVYSLSTILMPVFIAIVLAYLLEGIVANAEKVKISRFPAVLIVYLGFLAAFAYLLFVLMPIIYEQSVQLLNHIPDMLKSAQIQVMRLPQMYPQLISENKIRGILFSMQDSMLNYSQDVLSVSAASVVGLITAMVYLVLVPMMVFFLMKDKENLLSWMTQFLPKDRLLSLYVWREVDQQIGNYVRGKFVEVLLLWVASYITFSAMEMKYAMLLAVLMGLQVIIPYVGATLVTFPVLAVAYFQWGMSDEFIYVCIAYSIIQAIDGVVLVPLLFSEAVNLHPIAIIVAILFFGGLWGFWGVFFAIPLATLVKAVLNAWPKSTVQRIDTNF